VDSQNIVLIVRARVAEVQEKEESVELRLGQREGALEFHRILRRDDQEGIRERVRGLVDGDLALLHRLEECRLRPGGRAVDLIDEHDVRGERAGPVLERAGVLVVDRNTGDVTRHEVGRALDAAKAEVKGPRDGARERGLPHPGHVVEQDVTLHEKRAEQLLGHLPLSYDDGADVLDEALGRPLNGQGHLRTMRPPVSGRRPHWAKAHRESRRR
jgi:hypothetical protein